MSESTPFEEKLPLSQKVNYSLANMSLNTLNGIVMTGLSFFYVTILGLDLITVGNMWLIFGIWNAINDPLLGVVQDRTTTKIGRGKPYDDLLMVIRNALRDNVLSVLTGDILPDEAALKMQEDAIRLRAGVVEINSPEQEETGAEDS